VGDNWHDVQDIIKSANPIRSFPVNDKDGSYSAAHQGTGIHGQSTLGALKYDVVGFVTLKLVHLYDGNAPEVLGHEEIPGTPGGIQACPGWPDDIDFEEVPPNPVGSDFVDLTFDMTTCANLTGQPVIEPPKVKNATLGDDYQYDSVTDRLTWIKFPGSHRKSAEVTLEYVQPPVPTIPEKEGLCGPHFDGKEADKCLVTEWVGLSIGGGDPGSGADFGIRAIRLAQ
jgi:hypothetical protein